MKFRFNLLSLALLSICLFSCSNDEPKNENDNNEEGNGSKLKYEAVDLGLSVKWASCNVGASKPSDYGDYFCWGEVSKKEIYGDCVWDDVSLKELKEKGVIDDNKNLTAKYDAATVNCGDDWRMPTNAEKEELFENCTFEYTEMNGVKGISFVGSNGNSIFLPDAGAKDKGGCSAGRNNYAYWTSTALDSYNSYAIGSTYYFDRSFGLTIRPVKK